MKNIPKNKDDQLNALLDETVEQCRQNLKEIIDTEPVVYWARQLDVSKSLISSRWKKDHFPNIPNIIKLLMLSGYSANWLLLGIGPKYMSDVHDPDQSAADELRRRQTAVDLLQLEHQLSEEREKLVALKQYMEVHTEASQWIKTALDEDIFSKQPDQIRTDTGKSVFKQYILPLMTLMQSMNQISFKLFEAISDSEANNEIMEDVVRFIQSNLEKNQFALQSSLADLDTLIEESGIGDLLSPKPAKH